MAVQNDTQWISFAIFAVVMLGISLAFAVPTGVSASKRGMNALGWGALAFFTWLMGLLLFLLCKNPVIDDVVCVKCGSRIPKNHVYCPFCGYKE